MRFLAEGKLQLEGETLGAALVSLCAHVRSLACSATPPRIAVELVASTTLVSVLAQALPDHDGFRLGEWYNPNLSGRQFLADVRHFRRARCELDLGPPLDFDAILAVTAQLAAAIPPEDRRVQLQVRARPLSLADAGELSLALNARGGAGMRRSADVQLRTEASAEADPVLVRAAASVKKALGIKLARPRAAPGPVLGALDENGERRPTTSVEQWLPVVAAFEEAFARASLDIAGTGLSLDGFALLYPTGRQAFQARMTDVLAHRGTESVAFEPRLKALMRERFPEYLFEKPGPDRVDFRRRLAPTLDLVLIVRKENALLGKRFTLELGLMLPDTPLAGHRLHRTVFELFGAEFAQPAWAYSTEEDLKTALTSCGDLLAFLLPTLERSFLPLLVPLPSAIPDVVSQRGPLSAREAFDLALPLVHEWDPGAELESISCDTWPLWLREMAEMLEHGRLARHARWTFVFQSRARSECCRVTIPRIGRIRWRCVGLLWQEERVQPGLALDVSWADSTWSAAQIARWAGERASEGPPHVWGLGFRTGAGTATGTWHASVRLGRRNVELTIDGHDGSITEEWR